MKRIVASVVLAAFVSSGCAHTVVVDTAPTGAEVSVNGIEVGSSPATFTDEASTGKSYTLIFKKAGYKEKLVVLRQDMRGGRVAASVIGGLLCLIPFIGLLWSWELPQEHYKFTLQPEDGGGQAVPQQGEGHL